MKRKFLAVALCALFLASSVHIATVDHALTVSPCFIFGDMVEGY